MIPMALLTLLAIYLVYLRRVPRTVGETGRSKKECVRLLLRSLWSLLLVIPGIIAIYRYRFALYNLCENPELGVMDALRLSQQQTMGFKLDLFVLDVTFIGWGLLCGLTLGILSIWIQPYIQQTDLAYFDAIRAAKGMNGEAAEDDGFRPDDRF